MDERHITTNYVGCVLLQTGSTRRELSAGI